MYTQWFMVSNLHVPGMKPPFENPLLHAALKPTFLGALLRIPADTLQGGGPHVAT